MVFTSLKGGTVAQDLWSDFFCIKLEKKTALNKLNFENHNYSFEIEDTKNQYVWRINKPHRYITQKFFTNVIFSFLAVEGSIKIPLMTNNLTNTTSIAKLFYYLSVLIERKGLLQKT